MEKFLNVLNENFSAIIGIVGTLLGVVLGFVLEKIARIGRLKFYQNDLDFSITYSDSSISNGKLLKDKNPESLLIRIDIDLMNTSDYSKKSAREIMLEIKVHNKRKTFELYDSTTTRPFADTYKTDQLSIVHLEPKQVKNYKLGTSIDEYIPQIIASDWAIVYRNHKNKKKRVEINKNLLVK